MITTNINTTPPNYEEQNNSFYLTQLDRTYDEGVELSDSSSVGCRPLAFPIKAGTKILIDGLSLEIYSDAAQLDTEFFITTTTLSQSINKGAVITIDKVNLFLQYQRKTEGQVAGFNIDADGITKGGVEITGWLDSDTMTGATANNVPTAESVKAYVDSSGTKPNFAALTCSTTSLTSASNGAASAVVCQYDTETTTSTTNTIISYGAAGVPSVTGGEYSFSVAPDEDVVETSFEFTWNVGFDNSVVNNRILLGVKLQQGAETGGAIVWADVDPTHSYAYNRGAGAIRLASTSNGMFVIIEEAQPIQYFRLLIWKEAASNGSMKGITELNGTNFRIKQIN